MNLKPSECALIGKWVKDHDRVSADAVEKRIRWLTQEALEKVGTGNWTTLYRDPGDGRLWELTYPQGEMHGGGPMRLTVISGEQAKAKYPNAL